MGSNINMNKKVLNWFLNSGVSYDSDYQAWLTAAQTAGYTLPTDNVKLAQSDFVKSLKVYSSMYAKLVTLRFMHSGSAQMATLNVINAATHVATISGTLGFSEGNGVKSSSSSYIRDTIVANQWASIETDLTVIQYISESNTTASTTLVSHGFRVTAATANNFRLVPLWNASTAVKGSYNTATVGFPSTDHKGLYIHTLSPTSAISYKDGSKDTDANTPVAPDIAQPRAILAQNNNGGTGWSPTNFYTIYVAIDAVGHLFTDQDAADFRTAFLAYKTAVGLT